MYKGNWYDIAGRERINIRPITLDFDTLQQAVDEALHVLPDTELITINSRLDWGLISIETTKRMLICSVDE